MGAFSCVCVLLPDFYVRVRFRVRFDFHQNLKSAVAGAAELLRHEHAGHCAGDDKLPSTCCGSRGAGEWMFLFRSSVAMMLPALLRVQLCPAPVKSMPQALLRVLICPDPVTGMPQTWLRVLSCP